jgi:hypothetical protein
MKNLNFPKLTLLFFVVSVSVNAQDSEPYSPYVGQDFPNNVYFGDTHLHTSLSFDAYGDGNIAKDLMMHIDSHKVRK